MILVEHCRCCSLLHREDETIKVVATLVFHFESFLPVNRDVTDQQLEEMLDEPHGRHLAIFTPTVSSLSGVGYCCPLSLPITLRLFSPFTGRERFPRVTEPDRASPSGHRQPAVQHRGASRHLEARRRPGGESGDLLRQRRWGFRGDMVSPAG